MTCTIDTSGFTARCEHGECNRQAKPAHVVRETRIGRYGEQVSVARSYCAADCPVCGREPK